VGQYLNPTFHLFSIITYSNHITQITKPMKKLTQKIGMVHIKGVNDVAYKKFIDKVKSVKIEKTHLWYQLP
jgi:hypothetical protein